MHLYLPSSLILTAFLLLLLYFIQNFYSDPNLWWFASSLSSNFSMSASVTECQLKVNLFSRLVVLSVIFDTLFISVWLTVERFRNNKSWQTQLCKYTSETCLLLDVRNVIGGTLIYQTFWINPAIEIFVLECLRYHNPLNYFSAFSFFYLYQMWIWNFLVFLICQLIWVHLGGFAILLLSLRAISIDDLSIVLICSILLLFETYLIQISSSW